MVVTTDRPAYAPGDEVIVRVVATNRAEHDCADLTQSEVSIRNQDGQGVATWATIGKRDAGDWRWKAGDTREGEERWNQRSYTDQGEEPVPPGTYTVTITWSAEDENVQLASYTGSATFTIEAS
jgi:hypothetical protein